MSRNDERYEIHLRRKAADAGVIVMSVGLGCAVFVFALCMLAADLTWIAYAYILCHCAALICAVFSARARISRPAKICTLILSSLSAVFAIVVCAGLVFRLGVWMMLCFIPTVVLCAGAAIVILRKRG